MEKCYPLYKAVTHIAETSIEGDLVECGVWKGGSSMLAALTLQYMNQGHRKIYDTYTGMDQPSEKDIDIHQWPTARHKVGFN